MANQQPLQHVYPHWDAPHWDPHSDELVEVFCGDMRIVRNKQRAKFLRRRGVPMWKSGREWLWFVEPRTTASSKS